MTTNSIIIDPDVYRPPPSDRHQSMTQSEYKYIEKIYSMGVVIDSPDHREQKTGNVNGLKYMPPTSKDNHHNLKETQSEPQKEPQPLHTNFTRLSQIIPNDNVQQSIAKHQIANQVIAQSEEGKLPEVSWKKYDQLQMAILLEFLKHALTLYMKKFEKKEMLVLHHVQSYRSFRGVGTWLKLVSGIRVSTVMSQSYDTRQGFTYQVDYLLDEK